MTETKDLNNQDQPFKDIVNLNLQNIYRTIEEKHEEGPIIKKVQSQFHIINQQSKTISKKETDTQINKTIVKNQNGYKPQFMSTKTINQHSLHQQAEILDNPEWDILNGMVSGEVAHILRLQNDFKVVVDSFIEVAKRMKLCVCQRTDSFVTVKKGNITSCKCIFQMWTGGEPDATVYQLRKYGRGKEAKLIMVEGQEMTFHSFFLAFLRVLQQRQLVRVHSGEKVQMIFDEQSIETYQCAKQIDNYSKRLCKGKHVKNQQITNIVLRIKHESFRLKKVIYSTQKLDDLNIRERQIQELCYRTCGIASMFEKLMTKEFHHFREKRQKILKRFPLSEVFRQLEIGQHYTQFRRVRSLKAIQDNDDKIPYMPAIRCLKKVSQSHSPAYAYEAILQFHQKIRTCYNDYFKNSLKLGDMDDYLPVTIFCVLAVQTETNLLGITKWLLLELTGVDDYEWQKKTLTDFEAAFDYILNQWQLK